MTAQPGGFAAASSSSASLERLLTHRDRLLAEVREDRAQDPVAREPAELRAHGRVADAARRSWCRRTSEPVSVEPSPM